MPGVKSLEKQEYYAHHQNQFWKIIFLLFHEEFSLDYSFKINVLEKNKIALWDVIESCERKGSADTEIKNESANEIPNILRQFPRIRAIFCNGQKSYKNLQKILGKDFEIPIYLLPSTSPLHTISLERKYQEWKKILEYLP